MPRKAMSAVPTEQDEQIRFAAYLRAQGIRFHASPNGGSRNILEAVSLKRMGLSPGFPDIEIPLPVHPYHGLYIEMKRIKNSRPSPQQIDWIKYLREKGYYADFAYGFDEAKEILLYYLSLGKKSA